VYTALSYLWNKIMTRHERDIKYYKRVGQMLESLLPEEERRRLQEKEISILTLLKPEETTELEGKKLPMSPLPLTSKRTKGKREITRPVSLKEKIANAIYRLNFQKEKLDEIVIRLQHRDKELFQRCVGAQLAKDLARAMMYANECAEIRKIVKTALSSQLALERVIIRLQTAHEFGDVVLLLPIMSIVKEIKENISGVVPEVAGELEEINGLLSEIKLEAGEVGSKDLDIKANEEAVKVLQESSLIAEQKIREKFPEIPSFETMPTTIEKQPTPIAEGEGPISLEDQVIE
jgi:division protein CdvB (Snf7/Vps24/ESCRT-III family)